MKMPEPIWPMTYSASRRKHHHRCKSCNKIIKDGEAVLMAKVVGRKTQVVHDTDACARTPIDSGWTMERHLKHRGLTYLAACGWPEAERQLVAARAADYRAREATTC